MVRTSKRGRKVFARAVGVSCWEGGAEPARGCKVLEIVFNNVILFHDSNDFSSDKQTNTQRQNIICLAEVIRTEQPESAAGTWK